MIQEIPAVTLKSLLDGVEGTQLVDVRSPQEHAYAAIPGAKLLDQAYYNALVKLPKDAKLVFTCHHGERSRAAARHFVELGFTNVFNVSDGIDGWSLNVDPSVRRY